MFIRVGTKVHSKIYVLTGAYFQKIDEKGEEMDRGWKALLETQYGWCIESCFTTDAAVYA